MDNYKSILNLPKTKFPMRGNLTKNEPEILNHWINDDLYHVVRLAKKGKKVFVLHDGPPYANGDIHIGHAVNKILKDIIIKSKGLSGFDAPYVPGWDCHGLPIEIQIEKEYGKPGEKLTFSEFRIKCREYANIQIENQRRDFIRLGILGDWFNPYLTMNFKTEANTIRILGKMVRNNYVYRGIKPVHWCIECRSTLAEAEIEFFEQTLPSINVIFEAISQDIIKEKFNLRDFDKTIFMTIWTTTPWTLSANRAISLSSKIRYALVEIRDKALILAEDLVKDFMKYIKIADYAILSTIVGFKLELMRFKHPFLNYDVPVVLSDHVKLGAGTGAVHIAGSHGQDDYNVSLKYNLEILNLINPDGTYIPDIHPLLDGINVFEANDVIVNMLRKKDKLLHFEKTKHNYPCCWRHKSPIIFCTTPQWFINLNKNELRKQLLQEIKKVKWIPNWGQTCIESMIINRPDWCISRQRVCGVPISLFIHKETNDLHPNTLEFIEQVAKKVEKHGVQAWWDLNVYDIIGDDATFYKKVPDTLDVWFDSGSTHTSVVQANPKFSSHIADIYLEGSDQHRGWFMSSLIISTAIQGKAPYRQVLTHGFVVDNQGRKMSKSVGNVISPQNIVNNLGADILRLWVASANYTNEMAISDEILKRVSDNYRRIRNTARFLLANINDFNPYKDIIIPEKMIVLDRWAVSRAKKTQDNILKAYEAYNFHEVVKYLIHFCSIEMGSLYLDIIKDRQYTLKVNSIARRSCQTAIYHILEALVRWIAPIISFTSDEIWRHLPGKREKYVFTNEWYGSLFELSESEPISDAFWYELFRIRDEVNKIIEQARIKKKIGGSLEASITLYVESRLKEKLTILGEELRFFLLTSSVKVLNFSQATSDAKQSPSFNGLKITLSKADGKKCQRCWHYTIDVDQTVEHQVICKRCISNIFGKGEKRRFI